ncbi:hypothetical protein LWI29_006188 [Acer saccharum]|uniref:Uncharacterized protein n=1 Tax=Acer saccharum TaxID=4024 RepID=A0AA39SU89_ACESA|nr:hypothetical protein LWI29_006188 [Acer saccharum]
MEESLLQPAERKWVVTRLGFVEELKKLSFMAAPMVVVSVSNYLLQVVSMMMVGHLGELSLSGVAIATSFTNVTGFTPLVDQSAESERINRSESELSKNEIGDDDFCDVLGDRVVDCVDSVQEKVVDCLDIVKNGGFPSLVKVPSVLVVSSDCGELIGVENGGLSDSEVTVLVKDSANEDDCNAVAVTQGVQFESSVGAKENVFEVVDDTVEEKLVISCVVMVKAIDLGVVIKAHVGFSEFKIKLERRRQ